jgi:hypothetical protein
MLPGLITTTPANSGSGAYQVHDFNQQSYGPAQQETLPTEIELLRHQLHLRDSHIHQLEQKVRQRDLAIAKLEVHLEHGKTDTQAALKTVVLLSTLLSGRHSQGSVDSVCKEQRPETVAIQEGCAGSHSAFSSTVQGLEKGREANDVLQHSGIKRETGRRVPL